MPRTCSSTLGDAAFIDATVLMTWIPPRLSPSRSTSMIVRGTVVGTGFSAFFVICFSPCRTAVVRGPVTRPVGVLSGLLGPIGRLACGETLALVLPMTAVLGADEPRDVVI